MTTKYILQTFDDLVNAVLEELGADSNDTRIVTRVKRDINEVYLQEVVPEQNWSWLTKQTEVQSKAYLSTGTATVTANSCTVTLTEAPTYSCKGYLFSADGYNEVYRVAQHSAASTTLTLETPYSGTTSSTASYKLWTDTLALPSDCMSTLEVRHSFRNIPLEGVGRQEYRKLQSTAPRAEARPECYTTGSIIDPVPYDSITSLPATATRSSSGLVRTIVFNATLGASEAAAYLAPGDRIEVSGAGHYAYNGEWVVSSLSTTSATNDTITFTAEERKTESSTADTGITIKKIAADDKHSKYRELLIYPSLYSANTTLYVDYLQEPTPLVDTTDEPLIPLKDRNVLLYGALSRQWVKARNEDTANRNQILFEKKLGKMAGRVEDSIDLPQIKVSPQYLRGKRRSGRGYAITSPDAMGFGIGGGATQISGTASMAAVFDSSGKLASSSTVSTTELGYLDGVTGTTGSGALVLAASPTLSGVALVGGTSAQDTGISAASTTNLQIRGTGTGLDVNRYINSTSGPNINLRKSRSGTVGTGTVITTGDEVGKITFQAIGTSGTSYSTAATIVATSEGTIGSTAVPANIALKTADSSGVLTSAISVDSTQSLNFLQSANELAADNQSVTFTGSKGPHGITLTTTANPSKWLAVKLSDGSTYYLPLYK